MSLLPERRTRADIGPNPAGRNPTAWVETKSGITSDVQDALMKKKGLAAQAVIAGVVASAANAATPARAGPGAGVGSSPTSVLAPWSKGADFNAPSLVGDESAYRKLLKETERGGTSNHAMQQGPGKLNYTQSRVPSGYSGHMPIAPVERSLYHKDAFGPQLRMDGSEIIEGQKRS
jgi:hypothetical protein